MILFYCVSATSYGQRKRAEVRVFRAAPVSRVLISSDNTSLIIKSSGAIDSFEVWRDRTLLASLATKNNRLSADHVIIEENGVHELDLLIDTTYTAPLKIVPYFREKMHVQCMHQRDRNGAAVYTYSARTAMEACGQPMVVNAYGRKSDWFIYEKRYLSAGIPYSEKKDTMLNEVLVQCITAFYPDGKTKSIGYYYGEQKVGQWKEFNPNDSLTSDHDFGFELKPARTGASESETTDERPSTDAMFLSGAERIAEFLLADVKPQILALEKFKAFGLYEIYLKVNYDGSVSVVDVKGKDAQSVRACLDPFLKRKWKPATYRGENCAQIWRIELEVSKS